MISSKERRRPASVVGSAKTRSALSIAVQIVFVIIIPRCRSLTSAWWTLANWFGKHRMYWHWDQQRAALISMHKLVNLFIISDSCSGISLISTFSPPCDTEMWSFLVISGSWMDLRVLKTVGNQVCPLAREALHLKVVSFKDCGDHMARTVNHLTKKHENTQSTGLYDYWKDITKI